MAPLHSGYFVAMAHAVQVSVERILAEDDPTLRAYMAETPYRVRITRGALQILADTVRLFREGWGTGEKVPEEGPWVFQVLEKLTKAVSRQDALSGFLEQFFAEHGSSPEYVTKEELTEDLRWIGELTAHLEEKFSDWREKFREGLQLDNDRTRSQLQEWSGTLSDGMPDPS